MRKLASGLDQPAGALECDVQKDDDVARVFGQIGEAREWGQLDVLVHSLAFAPRARRWTATSSTPAARAFTTAFEHQRLFAHTGPRAQRHR